MNRSIKKVQSFITNNLLWLIAIFFLDYSYTMTFTFDSAHYLWLSTIISGEQSWQTWVQIRGFAFPLLLNITTKLLGENLNSFLALFTILHCILFLTFSYFLIDLLKIKRKNQKIFFKFLILILIIFDPIIFGYYHVVLTEAVAATLLTISVTIAWRLYQDIKNGASLKSCSKYLLFFYISVPFGWFLKQPFLFTALIPLILSILLVLYRTSNIKIIRYLIIHLFSVILFFIFSLFSWNSFLEHYETNDSGLSTNSEISKIFDYGFKTIKKSPLQFIKNETKNYLALSNILFFNIGEQRIENNISFFRANENGTISYRLYTYGMTNCFPVTEFLHPYIIKFESKYFPPFWLNKFFSLRFKLSNFLFSILYLILPFYFLFYAILFIFRKNINEFLFISSGTVFANALIYTISNIPIDRYFFPGYPSLLFFILYYLLIVIKYLYNKLFVRQK